MNAKFLLCRDNLRLSSKKVNKLYKVFVAIFLFFLFCFSFLVAREGMRAAQCPDWSFHLCYAREFGRGVDVALRACNSDYEFYPPLVHAVAWFFSNVFEVNIEIFFAAFVALLIVFLAFLLLRANIISCALYFFGSPLVSLILNKPFYVWISMAWCGLVAWFFVSVLAVFLVLRWYELSLTKKILICLIMLFSHSASFALVLLIFFVSALAKLFAPREFRNSFRVLVTVLLCFIVAVFNNLLPLPELAGARLLVVSLPLACVVLGAWLYEVVK